jgi:hypothetical protein
MTENIYKRLDSLEIDVYELQAKVDKTNIAKLEKEIKEMRLFLEKVLEYSPRKIPHRR